MGTERDYLAKLLDGPGHLIEGLCQIHDEMELGARLVFAQAVHTFLVATEAPDHWIDEFAIRALRMGATHEDESPKLGEGP